MTIHGDQACPAIIHIDGDDVYATQLSAIAWRARLESGELPVILHGPSDSGERSGLIEQVDATRRASGRGVSVIELYSFEGLDPLDNPLEYTGSRVGGPGTLIQALHASMGTTGPAFGKLIPPGGTSRYRDIIASEHPDSRGIRVGLSRVHMTKGTARPAAEAAPSDTELAFATVLADLIRTAVDRPASTSPLASFSDLLTAFGVTDRGSLSQILNLHIGAPQGLGIELYFAPPDEVWVGMGGEGIGIEFPTSMRQAIEAARSAYEEFAGDLYYQLGFGSRQHD